jgi:SAM-dependent methyltransferase
MVRSDAPHAAAVAFSLMTVLGLSCGLASEEESPSGPPRRDASAPASPDPSLEDAFNKIYQEAVWGKNKEGEGNSGLGSTVEDTKEYRQFIERFIREKKITSIVDAGCGDWEFSKEIDWGGASYLGVDISSVVIEKLGRYATDKIKFQLGDVTEELPSADLLIVKDVLQHLPNSLIEKFIVNNLRPERYSWVLLTNDKWPTLKACRLQPGSNLCKIEKERRPSNGDIEPGGYRKLDLSKEPFGVEGLRDVMRFRSYPVKVVQLWVGNRTTTGRD